VDCARPHRGGHRQISDAWPRSGGFIVTALIGIVGALIGGFISTRLGFGDVTGLNIASILIAVVGSVVLLLIYRLVVGNKVGTPRP
jgi:uncharacterized membrane protein YeaQ/YmgE (transglycosylase-associated protein family)